MAKQSREHQRVQHASVKLAQGGFFPLAVICLQGICLWSEDANGPDISSRLCLA